MKNRNIQESERRCLLVHYTEIGLKGKNQPEFLRQFRDNLKLKLRDIGLDWKVEHRRGYLLIEVPTATERDLDETIEQLKEVIGVAWVCLAFSWPHEGFTPASRARDRAELDRRLAELADAEHQKGGSFCVRVKRIEKALPFTSDSIEPELGAIILERTRWERVNLTRPDITFHVEFHRGHYYLYGKKHLGPGGLPVGIAGKVLVMLSGGIDSPVAAYLMARRGCRVDFLHFTASSTEEKVVKEQKIWRIARRLAGFTIRSQLYVVPYTYFDLALMSHPVDHELIVFRRFIARVAERLAIQTRAQALVSGDNLSQVASQTLSNLVSTSRGVNLPVFRPLLTYNKEEIIHLARRIGTYDDSILPYKDCCALLSRHPKTRSDAIKLEKLEERLFPDYEKLVTQTLSEAMRIPLRLGRQGED